MRKGKDPKKYQWIYWRYKYKKQPQINFIQNIVNSQNGVILHLSKDLIYEPHPLRVFKEQIIIKRVEKYSR